MCRLHKCAGQLFDLPPVHCASCVFFLFNNHPKSAMMERNRRIGISQMPLDKQQMGKQTAIYTGNGVLLYLSLCLD